MPAIEINVNELNQLIGKNLEVEELEHYLNQIALDVEEKVGDIIKAEYNPNRPDYCTIEGIARQIKGYLEIEKGIAKFNLNKGNITLDVEESVNNVRPFIVCGVVKGVTFNYEGIQKLMKIQEDLHWLVGRNRIKAAIGVHDLNKITPPFRYIGAKPEEISFVPLGENKKMNLKEILKKHPKGIEYANLVNKSDRYPIILDSNNEVLSFPPIINGILTQVNNYTTDLFLDITGHSLSNITMALNIMATALSDQGGKLETVKVSYPDKELVTPNLTPETIIVSLKNIIRTLGLKLSINQIIEILQKVRFGASKYNEDKIKVEIPKYRFDILHEVDIIEEIAVGYGYENIIPSSKYSMTIGKPNPINNIIEDIRQVLNGLKLLEVVNFTLTNEADHFEKMLVKGDCVKILNPISSEYSMIRTKVLPSLLKVFSINKHSALPQKIFEIGDIVNINEKVNETKTKREINIAIAVMNYQSDFTSIKTITNAFFRELGVDNVEYKYINHPSFIEGRTAGVLIDDNQVGIVGEINPQVLINFELENPVSAGEFSFNKIKEILL